MIPSLRNQPNEEMLSHLNLFSLECRRLRGKLSEWSKILISFINVDLTERMPTTLPFGICTHAPVFYITLLWCFVSYF